MRWSAFITYKNAHRIISSLRLISKNVHSTRKEVKIDDAPKTWIREGEYKHLFVWIEKRSDGYKLNVRGSLHKFYHGNNSGCFTGMEVSAALDGMFSLFEVDALSAKVHYIEVGVNLPTWFSVYPFLLQNLIFHKKKTKQDKGLEGIGFFFEHDDYKIKLYAKGQYILRTEVEYNSKSKLEGFGIYTAADLNEETINALGDSLAPEFAHILMQDNVDFFNEKKNSSRLSEVQLNKLRKFTSIGYQNSYEEELKKTGKAGNKKFYHALRKRYSRLQNECRAIIHQKGDGTHLKLVELIKDGVETFKTSWSEMSHFPCNDKAKESETLPHINLNIPHPITDKSSIINRKEGMMPSSLVST